MKNNLMSPYSIISYHGSEKQFFQKHRLEFREDFVEQKNTVWNLEKTLRWEYWGGGGGGGG
jgi:hypothetical protein